MNIQINGMIWIKSIVKQPPLSLFPSWRITFVLLFVTLLIVLFTYYLLKGASANSYSDDSGTENVKYFCPEIEKQHILYPYYISTIQNSRPYQEDRYCVVGRFNGDDDTTFYGVFDGHGGSKCSQFCATNLHSSIAKSINTSPYKEEPVRMIRNRTIRLSDRKAGFIREMDIVNGFQLCDAKYRRIAGKDDGSTAVTAFLSKARKQLITAHVGDSRAIMITEAESYDLTADHKPSNPSEKERVELLGGRIIQYGVPRVQGVLAVTRALGDYSLRPYVSNVPVVNYYELTGKECFLVMASDGLWDVMDHKEVGKTLHKYLLENHSIKECAQHLSDIAVMKQSMDNITVMIIDLRSPQSTFGTSSSVVWNKEDSETNNLPEERNESSVDSFLEDSIDALEQTFSDISF